MTIIVEANILRSKEMRIKQGCCYTYMVIYFPKPLVLVVVVIVVLIITVVYINSINSTPERHTHERIASLKVVCIRFFESQ